jgi:predicted membrane protein
MKKTGITFMIVGVAIIILQLVFYTHLNHNNVVDSRSQTIYINGIRSFMWPSFVGGVLFMIGIVTMMIKWEQPGHRY